MNKGPKLFIVFFLFIVYVIIFIVLDKLNILNKGITTIKNNMIEQKSTPVNEVKPNNISICNGENPIGLYVQYVTTNEGRVITVVPDFSGNVCIPKKGFIIEPTTAKIVASMNEVKTIQSNIVIPILSNISQDVDISKVLIGFERIDGIINVFEKPNDICPNIADSFDTNICISKCGINQIYIPPTGTKEFTCIEKLDKIELGPDDFKNYFYPKKVCNPGYKLIKDAKDYKCVLESIKF